MLLCDGQLCNQKTFCVRSISTRQILIYLYIKSMLIRSVFLTETLALQMISIFLCQVFFFTSPALLLDKLLSW